MKIKLSSILMFLTVMPALITDSFAYLFGIPANITMYLRLFDVLVIILLYLITRSKLFITTTIIYIIYATIFCSAYLSGNINLSLTNLLPGLLFCMLFDFWLKRDRLGFIRMMSFILSLYVYINFICIILYPGGMYATSHYTQNWFLGYKNSHMGYIFAAMTIRNIYSLKVRNKLSHGDVIFMIVSCFSLFIVDAMTGFVAVFCYTMLVLRYHSNHRTRLGDKIYAIANFRTIVIVSLIMNVSIVLLGQLSVVTEVLLPMLGRSSTFTGRTTIWNVALNLISQKPILGYGDIQPSLFSALTGIYNGTHAHNYILHVFIMGGAVCAIEHIILYWYIIKNSKTQKTLLVYCVGLTLGIYFLTGLTSINFSTPLFNCLFIIFDWAIRENLQPAVLTANTDNAAETKAIVEA